jgi:enamine deaminase RidA (YjgF/YER057c/UK114 family)
MHWLHVERDAICKMYLIARARRGDASRRRTPRGDRCLGLYSDPSRFSLLTYVVPPCSSRVRCGQLPMLLRFARTANRPSVTRCCPLQATLSSSAAAPLSTGSGSGTASNPEERLQAVLHRLEVDALPPTPRPGGLYVPTIQHGNLLYVSGHIPYDADGEGILGLATRDEDIPRTKLAAAHNALSILSTVRSRLGTLNRVKRLVKSLCMVNCTNEFGAHPVVMNGYSEVMQEVFGPVTGVGVRSAVGMVLPYGMATEVECVFELHVDAGEDAAQPRQCGGSGAESSAAFSKALGSSGLAEAVQILKAEAPMEWLIYGSSIESNLKSHFAARRADKAGGGTIL